MINTKKLNITYYIGAGYSAHAIPVVKEFQDGIRQNIDFLTKHHLTFPQEYTQQYREDLKQSLDNLIKDMEWLMRESDPARHATVDTYAKLLYLTNKRKYYELKSILSCYFLLEQIEWDDLRPEHTRLDTRYDTFFASIIHERGVDQTPMIDPRIKVISWNYDSQFEIACAPFYPNSKDDILRILQGHLYTEAMMDEHHFTLQRLNGVAGVISQDIKGKKSTHDIFSVFQEQKNVNDRIIRILFLYSDMMKPKGIRTYEPTISFAWEKESSIARTAIKRAKQIMQHTDILVIGGYSFPYYNRETDRILFSAMENLEEIYINDNAPEVIEEKLSAIMPELLRERPITRDNPLKIDRFTKEKIKLRNNTDQFFIPDKM